GGAVAVDGQIAADGRQAVRPVPEVVYRRQVVGAGGQVDDVVLAVAVGRVNVGDQSGHVARADVEHGRRRAVLQPLQTWPHEAPRVQTRPRATRSLDGAGG